MGRHARRAAVSRRRRRGAGRTVRLRVGGNDRRRRHLRGAARTGAARCSSTTRRCTIASTSTPTEIGDYPDNPRRFAVLVRAALEFASRRGARPTIVHAHDWQAGLAPVYLKTLYATHPVLGGVAVGVHDSQPGVSGAVRAGLAAAARSAVGAARRSSSSSSGDKSVFSRAASTTRTSSRRSARNTRRKSRRRSSASASTASCAAARRDLVGILNGIDTTQWDPARDPYLPEPFSVDDLLGQALRQRPRCWSEYGLPADERTLERPLIGMISRMVDQKGLDLIAALAGELAAPRRHVRRPRHRRAALSGSLATPGRGSFPIASARGSASTSGWRI